MKKTLLSLFLVLATSFTLLAQSLTEYSWKQHGVSFKVPSGAKVVTNNSEVFEVDNSEYNVKLEVVKGYELTPEEIGSLVVELASEKGMKVGNAEIQTFDGPGYWGISIEGERKGDKLCCAFLVSNNSDMQIFISVQYGYGLEEEANNIVNSVKMTK